MRNMDWIALMSTLLLLLSVIGQIEAGARKKIRIHIPQKVKHIHHHRKIYITQHKAPTTAGFAPLFASASHYAPAFPAEATATAIALLPLSEERASSPSVHPTAPNLQPLYRARGHYGPAIDYSEPKPIRYSEPRPSSSSGKNKIKIVKVTEGDKKVKVSKKKKPKRIVIKDDKDDDSVSTFHDEFYSDVNAGVIKKVKKPKRVEKIIDGDTEHIHTYTEEHIHQFVFDDHNGKQAAEASAIMPLALGGPSPLEASAASHALMPLDIALHHAAESAIYPTSSLSSHKKRPDHLYDNIDSAGTMGTPANIEYMGYDPSEATHDHMYHDHGEIMRDVPYSKVPPIPKTSYNSQGIKLNPSYNKSKIPQYKGKGTWVPIDNKPKETEINSDVVFPPEFKPKKPKKIPNYASHKFAEHDGEIQMSADMSFDDSDVPHTTTYFGNSHKKKKNKNRPMSSPIIVMPHSLESSTTRRPSTTKRPRPSYGSSYTMKPYGSVSSVSSFAENNPHKLYKDLFADTSLSYASGYGNYRDMYRLHEPLEDTYPSYSTEYKKEIERPVWRHKRNKNKKKSVSTQNMSFRGQDHMTVIDHISDASNMSPTIHSLFKEPIVADYGYSSAENYYNDLTSKSNLGGMMPEASNTNFRIVGPPQFGLGAINIADQSQNMESVEATTTQPESEAPTTTPQSVSTTSRRPPRKLLRKRTSTEKRQQQQQQQQQQQSEANKKVEAKESEIKTTSRLLNRGRFKYGDKLQERYDYEDLDTLYI